MIEKALTGSKKYWGLIGFLLVIMGVGFLSYLMQWFYGLGITGMSRDVSWGLYIAQFTFLVGVAASAVMVVMPYYLHNYKAFGRITILGEFLAIASVMMCLVFIIADLGQPVRAMNIILHPTPGSILFWDMIVLNGYLLLNLLIGWNVLAAERKSVPPPAWVKPLIYLSIPWAVSIHTVTAFIYAGLPGRGFWLTAIMAPRFLASAFAAGPALLILLALIIRKYTKFDPGRDAIQNLGRIVTYAMAVSVFFVLLEIFTVFYSQIPEHMHHFEYLFIGLEGHGKLVPWMWSSAIMAIISLILLINPLTRKKEGILAFACVLVFLSLWIEKGLCLVITGFIPSPLDRIYEYSPTLPEISITLAVWAMGFLVLTILYKVGITVKEEIEI
ncbi:MAG: NrfD/PsrC family molybdoenzyme membrane anchor subunit [Thermodesulfobacteriota bacterium]|nr:NrfD/PsrC family molybdoenzyme membrane anchor subunit [Thermodesulfobacteriota bacterium]